ncbi:MAG: V-type ATP synthase subunit I [Actinomycetota bacterium]|nr:V-type ATP synthase subunit I [Actinomycetota bacterium]
MAVVKMKKVYLVAHSSLRQVLVDTLNEQGLLHIMNLREEIAETDWEPLLVDYQPDLGHLELLLSKVQFVLDFLADFEERKGGFLFGLIKEKVKVAWTSFNEIEDKIEFNDIYEECENFDNQLAHIRNEISQLKALKEDLLPWLSLTLNLSDLGETAQTVILIGQVPTPEFPDLQGELEENVVESELTLVSQDFRDSNFLLIFLKRHSDQVYGILQKHGFRQVFLPALKKTPRKKIESIEKECSALEREKEAIVKKIRDLLYLKPDLLVLYDFLENKRRKAEIQANFANTREAFMIEGWVEAEHLPEFQEKINQISEEIEVTFTDPIEGEQPPIVLKNKPIFRPFEVLTRLYGLPDYNEVDPTPYLAPFFFLFFGICLGDVGYGLMLALACWWVSKKLEVSENVKRFFHLLAYGGIASMIVGVLTGSYFCIDVASLPSFLKGLILIDPVNDAQVFLLLSIALGIIHVCFGVILQAVNNLRNQRIKDVVFDQIPTFLFLPAVLLWLACWLGEKMTKTSSPVFKNLYPKAMWGVGFGILLVIFLQGRYFSNCCSLWREMCEGIKGEKLGKALRSFWGIVFSIFFLVSICGWVLTLLSGRDSSSIFLKLIGFAILVGLFSKSSRSALVRFASGLYSLYGMTGFIGDFLSYARLMALGLATILIGWVINMLGRMLLGIPFLGIILMVLLLAVGHIFNLVINLLGAFVHPLRLQYVEFFKYFYSDGGRKFEPFKLQTKHLVLKYD